MSETSGFGKYVPGFEFLQSLAGQAASGVAHGLGQSVPQLPNLSHWVAPTFNVEELEKRIEELKAVHFWLDQNAKALAATIQALEVQKMTLATLKTMNFSLGDVANALKIKAADTVAGLTGQVHAAPPATQFAGLEIPPRTYGNPTAPPVAADEAPPSAPAPSEPAPAPRRTRKAAAPAPAPAAAAGVVDPMQWWGALSQQFQNIAANALKDVARQTALDATHGVASGLTEQAVKAATGVAGKAADTVARNVGAAVGMGQAAARAVTRGGKAASGTRSAGTRTTPPGRAVKPASQRPVKGAGAASAPGKAASKKAPPKARTRPAAPAAAKPSLSAGDWPLPAAFFPGFQVPAPAAPRPARSAPRKAAAKPAAKPATRRR
jgi:hypothetical protein